MRSRRQVAHRHDVRKRQRFSAITLTVCSLVFQGLRASSATTAASLQRNPPVILKCAAGCVTACHGPLEVCQETQKTICDRQRSEIEPVTKALRFRASTVLKCAAESNLFHS